MAGWADRAEAAESGICGRHLRRLLALPGTRLGVVGWPPSTGERLFLHWDYWWQAQLLDCLLDAQGRTPSDDRRRDISRVITAIRLRNGWRWVNGYYDDIAWLGLALERAELHAEIDVTAGLAAITRRLRAGWTDHGGGGIWWRVNDDFKNVPANGPAAILLARLSERGDRSDLQRARSTVDWIAEKLVDPGTGVVYDGMHVNPDGSVREVEHAVYTYCQGVYIGACVELAEVDASPRWQQRAARTVGVVAERMVTATAYGPVIRGQGGGDGGLFAGILVRYLAQAALGLADQHAVATAAGLVYAAADAAWENRQITGSGPVFGEQWCAPEEQARDLSVQLSAWMALEAAALLADGEVPDPR
ncbi:MAG: glycoside hydrolase family 76 protein [Sciscionella sp.]